MAGQSKPDFMSLVNLLISREQAKSKISDRIEEGRKLLNTHITTEDELQEAKSLESIWSSRNEEMLRRMFDNESIAEEYVGTLMGGVFHHYLSDKVHDFQRNIRISITRLQTILGKLDEIPERLTSTAAQEGQEETEQTVFISHSSEDGDVISTVKQAFEDLELVPLFNEKSPAGDSPARVIAERIAKSKALFVFFTAKSMYDETRDWIVFELGVAVANNKDIYSWKDNYFPYKLPRFTEQITTYSPFEVQTVPGSQKLQQQVKAVAKGLLQKLN